MRLVTGCKIFVYMLDTMYKYVSTPTLMHFVIICLMHLFPGISNYNVLHYASSLSFTITMYCIMLHLFHFIHVFLIYNLVAFDLLHDEEFC